MGLLVFQKIVAVIVGYAFGLFQSAYFIGKLNHVDIRTTGSGNAGTTNVLRVLGRKAGIFTFIGDFLKGFVCVLLVTWFVGRHNPDLEMIFGVYAAFGVALGHDFPFYMHFKGGKGVASTLGAMAALDWHLIVMPLFVFLVIVFFTRFISLGSVTAMCLVIIESIFFGSMGGLNVPDGVRFEFYIVIFLVAGMCILLHEGNIRRLRDGTERQIKF